MRGLHYGLLLPAFLVGCAANGDGNVVSDPEIPTAVANGYDDESREPQYDMACVDALYGGYGGGRSEGGVGPDQGLIQERGNEYLTTSYPRLDYIEKASIIDGGEQGTYRVLFQTSNGAFVVEVHEEWAPHGAARFRELVEAGFYDDCRFFRVIPGFMAQVGINGDPAVQAEWRDKAIPDDPVVVANTRGRVTFATSGPDSRTCQFFINFGNNSRLDADGFSPIGEVIDMPDDFWASLNPAPLEEL